VRFQKEGGSGCSIFERRRTDREHERKEQYLSEEQNLDSQEDFKQLNKIWTFPVYFEVINFQNRPDF